MDKEKIIGAIVVIIFFGVIAYFFLSTESATSEVPPYVTGGMREMYEWAKTPEGGALLENIPCYCGCKYEGHKHTRHCFWKDDGSFDKHGITCSVCFDIARKSKKMNEEGATLCEIRDAVDEFYAPNAHLGTPTPYPPECADR